MRRPGPQGDQPSRPPLSTHINMEIDMALEDRIADLVGAINSLTAAVLGQGQMALPLPEPKPKPEPALPVGEVTVVTMDDLRTALLRCNRDKARAILKQHGADKLPELPVQQYAAVLAAAREAA